MISRWGSDSAHTYFYPYGGYDGPRLEWVGQGETGVFALTTGQQCLRVVNDRRPIMHSYGVPTDERLPLEAYIANATLPTRAGCRTESYQASASVSSLSIPLVGSRAVWRLLQKELRDAEPLARACACVVSAQVWHLNEPCLDSLTSGVMDRSRVDSTRAENESLLVRETIWFRDDPSGWLRLMIEGWGLDGALVRLRELLARGVFQTSPSVCASLARGVDSGKADGSYSKGIEAEARDDFALWLNAGCPTTTSGLGYLLGNPGYPGGNPGTGNPGTDRK
jgi:hypothetical protein